LKAVPRLEHEFTYEEYVWAASIVQSRSFAIATEKAHKQCGGQSEKALVPLADLLNHRKQGSFTVGWGFDRKLDAFKLRAYTAIETGDALTDSYGESKSTDQFVRMYGFVPSTGGNGERLPPSLVSRNVNTTHQSLRKSLLYWYRVMREDRARRRKRQEEKSCWSSENVPKNPKACDCDEDTIVPTSLSRECDSGESRPLDDEVAKAAPVDAVEFTGTGGDRGDGKSIVGSASFRIRAKILLREDRNPTPVFIDDAKFIAYLRGVAQTFVDACDRAGPLFIPGFDTNPSHESVLRDAINAAVAMMRTPFRAIRVALIGADAESLALHMFADALGDVLRSYTTTLEEDMILLQRSRHQNVSEVLRAEEAERRESERERIDEAASATTSTAMKTTADEERGGGALTAVVITYNQQVALQLRMAEKAMVSSLRGMANEEANFLYQMGTLGRYPDDLTTRSVRIPATPSFAGDYLRVLGRNVWVKWRKGNFWYKGHVAAVHGIGDGGTMRFLILFDDGDREDFVTPENVLWGADPDALGLREVKRLGKNFLGRVLDEP